MIIDVSDCYLHKHGVGKSGITHVNTYWKG